jgi:uncharacterized protein
MTFLLDVNVLIALIDPKHVQHDAAHAWFGARGKRSWATCPLTENGVMRIVGHPRYPISPGTPAAVAPLVAGLRALPGHVFWPDDISLLDHEKVDTARLLTSGQVTDGYLLALAKYHGGQLATFDRRLIVDGVFDGAKSLHLIP